MSQLLGLQPLPQRPQPPLAAEEDVSAAAQGAQLLHASLLGPAVLEPNLQRHMSEIQRHEGRRQEIKADTGHVPRQACAAGVLLTCAKVSTAGVNILEILPQTYFTQAVYFFFSPHSHL